MKIEKLICKEIHNFVKEHIDEVENKLTIWGNRQNYQELGFNNRTDMLREIQNNNCYWEYKPFLFPLSNMTEEQEEELIKFMAKDWNGMRYHTPDSIDWLNKNKFDYRGLIPKGLANDATGLNIYQYDTRRTQKLS